MDLPAPDPARYSDAVSEQRKWTRAEFPVALDRALLAAVERGAKAPAILRLTEVAGYTDWALLLSARSERQVRGIVDGIIEALADGSKPSGNRSGPAESAPRSPTTGAARLIGSDGLDLYLWALLDYDDFLIHVFYHPVRLHYDLESMWRDAPRVELGLPAEVMDESELVELIPPDPMPTYRGDLAFGGFEDEFDDDDDDDGEDAEDPDFVDDELFDEPSKTEPGKPGTEPGPDDDLFES
jgi:ribosomal silencing factor RsfS